MLACWVDYPAGRSGKAKAAILRCTSMGSLTAPYSLNLKITRNESFLALLGSRIAIRGRPQAARSS